MYNKEVAKIYYQRNHIRCKERALLYYRNNREKINIKRREKRRLLNPQWFKRKKNRLLNFKEQIPYKTRPVCREYTHGTKERDLLIRYNLKWEDYQALIKKCNNLCPICGKQESRKRKDGTLYPLHIDHDHKTGKVRGLLCNKCNACLGLVGDSPVILQKMIDYLNN